VQLSAALHHNPSFASTRLDSAVRSLAFSASSAFTRSVGLISQAAMSSRVAVDWMRSRSTGYLRQRRRSSSRRKRDHAHLRLGGHGAPVERRMLERFRADRVARAERDLGGPRIRLARCR
jgi:hypothetical protein